MTEVAKKWDSGFYPELEAAGGLPGALQKILGSMPGGLTTEKLEPPFLVYATVRRSPRASQVMIAAHHRSFSVDFWHQGVQFGSGWIGSLEEAANAIHNFLVNRASAHTLNSSFPWTNVREQAYLHEQGPHALVEHAWRGYFDWLEKEPPTSPEGRLLPLLRACMARPRLRQLMPFTSHDRLCFSKTTGFPYTSECLPAFPIGENVFRIDRTDPSSEHFEGDAVAVALKLEASLPDNCGAAVHGTADDFELPTTSKDHANF